MDVGSGIAIAGVWICVGMCGLSSSVTGTGFVLAGIGALVLTYFIA